jgi:phage terminase large subunit-like protein
MPIQSWGLGGQLDFEDRGALSFTAVHASRGKYVRAEPCAALYEQAKVHHVGSFPQLEDQMTSFVPDIERGKMGAPDSLDALVWALTELIVAREKFAGYLDWVREQQAAVAAGQAG